MDLVSADSKVLVVPWRAREVLDKRAAVFLQKRKVGGKLQKGCLYTCCRYIGYIYIVCICLCIYIVCICLCVNVYYVYFNVCIRIYIYT